jgi:hypothetical protein
MIEKYNLNNKSTTKKEKENYVEQLKMKKIIRTIERTKKN